MERATVYAITDAMEAESAWAQGLETYGSHATVGSQSDPLHRTSTNEGI